jgi:hypothetical protein
MWLEVTIMASIFAIGNILFGHFEEGTPKWRRLLQFFLFIGVTILITETAGRFWFFVFLGVSFLAPLVIHLWWLPKHGINGWTGEPREKYYELRGWSKKSV